MKILFIVPHLSTGGCPQYLLKKIIELNDLNDVYCVEYDDITGGVLVVQRNQIKEILGSKLITLNNDKKELITHINNINPDVIHFEEFPEYFCDREVAKLIYIENRKYKIIETSHDSSFDPNNKIFIPDRFIFVSEYQNQLMSQLGIKSDVVEYPIEYKNKTDRTKALTELGLDPNKIHFINVGLFTSRKNQAEIIRYAKQLLGYAVQFHFVGNQADNFKSYWEPIMKNFPSNCKWWGERKDVDTFYNAMDVFLFTSKGTANDKETSPLVIREAIGWHLPLLMYNLPVYCGMYDTYKNITWLEKEFDKNLDKIKSFILNKEPIPKELFDISFNDENNKLDIIYNGKDTLSDVLFTVKDRDSKTCIYSNVWEFLNSNNSFWIMPLPKHVCDFKNDINFSGFLLQVFAKNKTEKIYEKEIILKNIDIKKPIFEFSDEDPIFNNYNEFFVDKIYDDLNLKNLNICFDIGSNVGLFTKYLKLNNCNKIFCFEPNKTAFNSLQKNLKVESDVELFNLAVSHNNEPLRLYIDDNNSLISSAHDIKNNYYDVETITLKDIFDQNKIQKVDFVKIDIEGMEFDLIENLEDSIFQKIDKFLIEYHDFYFTDGSQKLEKLKNKLNLMGYDIINKHKYIYACKDVKVNSLTLTEIQNINNFHTDKLWLHSYLDTYEDLFSKFRNKDINLLEIGIGNGGSLKLWQKYFTKKSNIYCIDIGFAEVTHTDLVSQENITMIWKDIESCTPSILSPIMFDIVIEDGSHTLEHQIKSWEVFKDRLNPGGILVIEDIAPESYDYFLNLSQKISNSKLIDLRHIKSRFDNFVFDNILFVYENK